MINACWMVVVAVLGLVAGWYICVLHYPDEPAAKSKPKIAESKRRLVPFSELAGMPDSIKRLSRFTFQPTEERTRFGFRYWQILAGDTVLWDGGEWCDSVSQEVKEMVLDDKLTLADAYAELKRQQVADAVDIATREWLTDAPKAVEEPK